MVAIAVVVIMLVLGLKLIALNEVLAHAGAAVLLVAPMVARGTSIALFLTTDYVSPMGLGSIYTKRSQSEPESREIRRERIYALIAAGAIAIVILGWLAIFIAVFVVVSFYGIRKLSMSRLGGFTGDVAGATIELTELVVLIAAALML